QAARHECAGGPSCASGCPGGCGGSSARATFTASRKTTVDPQTLMHASSRCPVPHVRSILRHPQNSVRHALSGSYFSIAASWLSPALAAAKLPSLYFCITSDSTPLSCWLVASSGLLALTWLDSRAVLAWMNARSILTASTI